MCLGGDMQANFHVCAQIITKFSASATEKTEVLRSAIRDHFELTLKLK